MASPNYRCSIHCVESIIIFLDEVNQMECNLSSLIGRLLHKLVFTPMNVIFQYAASFYSLKKLHRLLISTFWIFGIHMISPWWRCNRLMIQDCSQDGEDWCNDLYLRRRVVYPTSSSSSSFPPSTPPALPTDADSKAAALWGRRCHLAHFRHVAKAIRHQL